MELILYSMFAFIITFFIQSFFILMKEKKKKSKQDFTVYEEYKISYKDTNSNNYIYFFSNYNILWIGIICISIFETRTLTN